MTISLSRLTFTAWLSWLMALTIMAWLSYARVLHPSFLYMAIPLAVQLLCTAAIVLGGIWKIFRGPRRWRAAFWLWLGMMPTLWMATYIQYLFLFAAGRNHPPNVLVNFAAPVSSLVGEPYVRLHYPYRHEGGRFVMWSDSSEKDEKTMAAMDAHIRAMEKSLGQQSEYKVYWVRGPALGIHGRYVCGWSLGDYAKTPKDGIDGLNYMDRHEIAHFVLDQLLPRPDRVPMLFHEGWAESYSGPKSMEADRRSCCTSLHNRQFLSLRELTSPAWYHNSDGPVYPQGGVLVDYLLRRYGHEKFLELCRSCRPETFPDDVKRVLGVSLDELDDAYQEDILKQGKPEPTDKEYLLSMELGEKVLPDKWRQFVDDYCAGVERLRAAFRQSSVRLTTTQENVIDDDTGKGITTVDVDQYDSDGERQACTSAMTMKGVTNTIVAITTPELEFRLSQHTPDNSWQLQKYKVSNGRPRFARSSDNGDHRPYLWIPLYPLSGRSNADLETKIREIEATSGLLRVHFENFVKPSETALSRGWWDFDPERNYVLIDERWENLDGQGGPVGSGFVTVEYETIEGHTVLKTAQIDYKTPHQKSQPRTVKLVSCKFGPPRSDVFELSSYGNFKPSDVEPLVELPPPTPIGVLTWIADGWTALGLTIVFGSIIRKLRRPTNEKQKATVLPAASKALRDCS